METGEETEIVILKNHDLRTWTKIRIGDSERTWTELRRNSDGTQKNLDGTQTELRRNSKELGRNSNEFGEDEIGHDCGLHTPSTESTTR